MTTRDFDEAFQAVQKLATDFKAHYSSYVSAEYSEAQVRKDFIDKFFIALGWDVNNERHPNPFEQEVKVERPVAMGAAKRHADYAFHVAPNYRDARFIVEAKKPFGELATADNYFQTIRYGWNLQHPLAGLTDFEHFHLLDCRYKPDIDTAIHRCQEKWTLDDYCDRDKFARLYWLISREAVASGSLEKFAATLPRPRGSAKQRGLFAGSYKGIDESFLEDLDEHRNTLARAFKSRNPELDSETLTEATQRTLDRLVFMRFLEDKLIEPSQFVATFGVRGTAWQDFVAASRRLDGTYNGVVFKKHDILDAQGFRVDDDAFARICEDLSHKNSPYDFNAIPIHILGSIYERFLGNVIVATEKRVQVQPKPEVRKAGGVYYTPDYIVRYIVESTVGKLIHGKTPDEIAEMRFADIACGSGSFLLGVYDLLLRHHARYYNAYPRKALKNDCLTKDGVLHLSLEKKREILLNNIYGVDIDAQAVEVTQLSLYLKLLDEETIASARGYQLRIHAAILPPLNKNIVCGNSLIGRDVSNGNLFGTEQERTLNPMNFADSFPEIMKRGGFDAVVGNPPWGADFDVTQKRYLDTKYSLNAGKYESYIFFVEREIQLLKDRGRLGIIIPSYWISRSQTAAFRKHLSSAISPETFVVMPEDVFAGVKMDSCILTALKGKAGNSVAVAEITSQERQQCVNGDYLASRLRRVPLSAWKGATRAAFNPRIARVDLPVVRKIETGRTPLGTIVDITQGLTLYRRSTLTQQFGAQRAEKIVSERLFHATRKKDKTFKKELGGHDVGRYFVKWDGKSWVSYGPWLAHAVDERFFRGPRIVIQKLRNPTLKQRLVAGYLDDNETYSAGVLLNAIPKQTASSYNLLFVLGLLNSMLLNYWYRKSILDVSIRVADLEQLPVPTLDFGEAAARAAHDRMVRLVEQMMNAKTQFAAARSDKDKTFYENKCVALDRQVDTLVFDLYGLTAEEVRIVEDSAVNPKLP